MTEARKKIKFLWNNYHIHAFLKIRAPSGFISFGVFTTDASCCKRSCELLPHYLTCLAWPEIAQKIFQVFVDKLLSLPTPLQTINQPIRSHAMSTERIILSPFTRKKKNQPIISSRLNYLLDTQPLTFVSKSSLESNPFFL